jgi:hypothetical protein
MKRAFSGIAAILTLSGCATMGAPPAGPPVTVEELIRQIKHDIGEYNDYAVSHANDAELGTACKGKVDLTIKSVTVSVTTKAKTSQGSTAGAEVAPTAFLKLAASGAIGRSVENSQVLSFTLEPIPLTEEQLRAGFQAPIPQSQLGSVLSNLRESLLRASDTKPCLHFPEKDQDNSVEFGFEAVRNSSVTGGINLWIFAIGHTRASERTAAHSIKIQFEGSGQSFVPG